MKRSEYMRLMRLIGKTISVERAAEIAEEAGVTWDPEEPEGFDEWYKAVTLAPGQREKCLAAWNACLSRQEAQQRTIEHKVDPEARRKEIEAQIEAWLDLMGWAGVQRDARRSSALSLLRHVGVL